MLKYANTQIVFQEFPGETTLAINITGCPNKCPGCHSPHLWKNEGYPLNEQELELLLRPYNEPGVITCVGFMGGDNDYGTLKGLVEYIRFNYPHLKTGWYSGRDFWTDDIMKGFDYVKFGSYKKELGGLDSPTTNQVMYKYIGLCDRWLDITKYFQTKNSDYHKMVNNFENFIRTILNVSKSDKPSAEELFDTHKETLKNYFEKNC